MNVETPHETNARSAESGKLRIRALDAPAMSFESLRNPTFRLY
jgi:hypothetical protein